MVSISACGRGAHSYGIVADACRPRLASQQSRLLLVIQIMLTDVRFSSSFSVQRALDFNDAQKAVYAARNTQRLFVGNNETTVNLEWVLNAIQFFRHHLSTRENPELRDEYENLQPHEKIRAWRRPLHSCPQRLGKTWKGCYAHLDVAEVTALRALESDEDNLFIDNFNQAEDTNSPFQSLHLDFSSKEEDIQRWPRFFERHLQSLSHPAANMASHPESAPNKWTTRAQLRTGPDKSKQEPAAKHGVEPVPGSFFCHGSGVDEEKFHAAGWLNPLPPQEGIPGWMRFTMMKFYVDESDSDSAYGDATTRNPFSVDGSIGGDLYRSWHEDSLWAYEGVVLPGGEVIIGRWWSPTQADDSRDGADDVYSGPFLFWCVDKAGIED